MSLEHDIDELLDAAVQSRSEMTDEEREAQRRSFVYGNLVIDNPDVTPEMVNRIGDRMMHDRRDRLIFVAWVLAFLAINLLALLVTV